MAAPTNDKKEEAAGARSKATVRYVDRPECGETFADSVNSVFFDGQTMRIEFGITRMDDMKKDQPLTGRRYPACRLVLAPAAAIDLINKDAADRGRPAAAGRNREVGGKGRNARKTLISSSSKHIKKTLCPSCSPAGRLL
jgi:hypothetical protein